MIFSNYKPALRNQIRLDISCEFSAGRTFTLKLSTLILPENQESFFYRRSYDWHFNQISILARVHYFCRDWLWNNFFYSYSPPCHWFKKGCCQLEAKVYVHEVLVNRLVKLAQEKSVVRWTDRPYMTIAVDWDVKQTKQSLHNTWPIMENLTNTEKLDHYELIWPNFYVFVTFKLFCKLWNILLKWITVYWPSYGTSLLYSS